MFSKGPWTSARSLVSLAAVVCCGRLGYEPEGGEDAARNGMGQDGALVSQDASLVTIECAAEDPSIGGTLADETINVPSDASAVEILGNSVSIFVESLPLWLLLRNGLGVVVQGGYPAGFFTSGPNTSVEVLALGDVNGSLDELRYLGTCEDATPVSGFLRGRFGPAQCAEQSVTSTVEGIGSGDITATGVAEGVLLEYSQGIVAFNDRYPQGLAVVTGFILADGILYCFESVTTQTSAEGCVSAAFSDVAILGGVAEGSSREGELKLCLP